MCTGRQSEVPKDRRTNIPTYRHTEMKMYGHTQTNRQTDCAKVWEGRQTDVQKDECSNVYNKIYYN
jgi:hypothetical protein